MRRDIATLVVLTVVIGLGVLAAGRGGGSVFDGKPDFSGKWELNTGKSKFGKMPVPTRMTLVATKRDNSLHSVQTSYDQAGGPDATEGDWYLDGKTRPIGSDGKMSLTSRWDGNVLVSERKTSDGAYNEVIHVTVSGDGKTATEEIRLKSPNGNNAATLIWERK